MTNSGWRKPTPGLCQANALAKDGEWISVSKNRAMLALRRVAPALGLKPGELLLLDTLVVFTRPCDWEEGARPLVWPSNSYLVDNTGLSLSTVKRLLRNLAEKGLIAYKDSSNGHRWGRRDEDGHILDAYGFDLSPLSARTEEFESLYQSIRAERDRIKALKRKITIFRRTVWTILEGAFVESAREFWNSVKDRYDGLLKRLQQCGRDTDKLFDLYLDFGELKDDAEEALRGFKEAGVETNMDTSSDCQNKANFKNLNTRESDFEPDILSTNHRQPVKSNRIENATAAGSREDSRDTTAYLPFAAETLPENPGQELHGRQPAEADDTQLTLQSIMYACPVFAEMAHGINDYVRNWHDLTKVAAKIRPMIGISEDAWHKAQSVMGRERAATAIALITDKYSDGTISSPGGYLRGLSLKAEIGDLHLARSVFGRISARQAQGALS